MINGNLGIGTATAGSLLTVSKSSVGNARACNKDEDCTGAVIAKALTDSTDNKAIALVTLQ